MVGYLYLESESFVMLRSLLGAKHLFTSFIEILQLLKDHQDDTISSHLVDQLDILKD